MFSEGELHPGVHVALARLTMDELGIARAMAAGELTSPQRYENIWLFDIRITGTETAYRPAIEKSRGNPGREAEYAYRPPEHYLNEEFLARCNGLPVIAYHPKKSILSADSFRKQIEGTVLLPYIKGAEVWGIAKIYDEETATWMVEEQLSTSPAVVFRNPDVNSKITLESGDTLLIEGKPSLLDHIAICEHGVWDKGGEPTGVRADSIDNTPTHQQGTNPMAEEDKDTKTDSTDDKVLKAIDALCGRIDRMDARMDSLEKSATKADADDDADDGEEKKADADDGDEDDTDPKEVVADKKKKAKADDTGEDDKDEDAKADSVPRSEFDALRSQLAALDARVKPMSDEDRDALNAAQARADSVYSLFGKRAPRALDGEAALTYRRRLLREMQAHSPEWAKEDLSHIATDSMMGIAERQIFEAAVKAAHNPVDLPHGELREIATTDATGRAIKSFVGKPSAWMSQFQPPNRRFITQIEKGV